MGADPYGCGRRPVLCSRGAKCCFELRRYLYIVSSDITDITYRVLLYLYSSPPLSDSSSGSCMFLLPAIREERSWVNAFDWGGGYVEVREAKTVRARSYGSSTAGWAGWRERKVRRFGHLVLSVNAESSQRVHQGVHDHFFQRKNQKNPIRSAQQSQQ